MFMYYKKKLYVQTRNRSFSINFKAKGWSFLAGMFCTMAFLSICGFVGYLE